MKRTLIAALLCLLPVAAQAQGENLRWSRCTSPDVPPDDRILACNILIKDNVTQVGFAYVGLGDAYAAKGDTDHALEAYGHLGSFKYWPVPFLHRAILYASMGKYDEAMADADKAVGMRQSGPDALGVRCWVHALAGKGLDAGLADCNAALEGKPSDRAGILDSKGLILFKLGRMPEALAAYSDAVAANGQQAPSLYMRGVIKKLTGNAAGGDADIAAATAIDADVAGRVAGTGVEAPR